MLRIGQVETTATSDGLYTDGSVAGGIAATRLRASAFNAMQEELAHIVEEGGDALSIDDMTQVLKALKKLFLSRSNPFGDIALDGPEAIALALSNLRLVTNGFVGRLVNVITISSSTTYTPTEGVKKIIIEACGGGGGGGAAMATAASQSSVGTGGAAADYVRTSLIEAKPLQITIGSGGSGGNGTSSAAPGGVTTVGDIISCRGGPGGAAGVASSTPITSNTGGGFTGSLTAPTDSVIVNGGLGIRGFIVNPGSASGQVAGTGGSTPLGRGADGQQAAAGNPAPENNYGCGGAGGANQGSSAIKFGGDGMSGVVIIREYA